MKPVLQALLLADRVYQDKVTGKHIVAGIFSQMLFVKDGAKPRTKEVDGEERQVVPGGMQAGSPYAYISLTDFQGSERFVLRYVDLDEDTPIFEAPFTVSSDDRLKTVEITAPLPPLPITKAGTFALELLWKNEPLGSFRVIVQEMQIKGTSDDTDTND